MRVSRECVLHYPFPVKLWLCAKSNCVDSIYWNANGKTVVIDVFKLQKYLETIESIFNLKSISDFTQHLDAFRFERRDEGACVFRQYYHKYFRTDSVVDLKHISVDGFTLYCNVKRAEMSRNADLIGWFEASEESRILLWDFGDFEFNFEVFEFHVEDILKLMLHLYNAALVTQTLGCTHNWHWLYCYHMHNIILPATWIPGIILSLPGPTVSNRMISDDAMLLEEDLPDEKRDNDTILNNYIDPVDLLETCKVATALANEIPFATLSVQESGDHIEIPHSLIKHRKSRKNAEKKIIKETQSYGIEPLIIKELTDDEFYMDGTKIDEENQFIVEQPDTKSAFTNKVKEDTCAMNNPIKTRNLTSDFKKSTDNSQSDSERLSPRSFASKLIPIVEKYLPKPHSNIFEPIKSMEELTRKMSQTFLGESHSNFNSPKRKTFIAPTEYDSPTNLRIYEVEPECFFENSPSPPTILQESTSQETITASDFSDLEANVSDDSTSDYYDSSESYYSDRSNSPLTVLYPPKKLKMSCSEENNAVQNVAETKFISSQEETPYTNELNKKSISFYIDMKNTNDDDEACAVKMVPMEEKNIFMPTKKSTGFFDICKPERSYPSIASIDDNDKVDLKGDILKTSSSQEPILIKSTNKSVSFYIDMKPKASGVTMNENIEMLKGLNSKTIPGPIGSLPKRKTLSIPECILPSVDKSKFIYSNGRFIGANYKKKDSVLETLIEEPETETETEEDIVQAAQRNNSDGVNENKYAEEAECSDMILTDEEQPNSSNPIYPVSKELLSQIEKMPANKLKVIKPILADNSDKIEDFFSESTANKIDNLGLWRKPGGNTEPKKNILRKSRSRSKTRSRSKSKCLGKSDVRETSINQERVEKEPESESVCVHTYKNIVVNTIEEMTYPTIPIENWWKKPKRCNPSSCTCLCNSRLFPQLYENN